MLFIITIITSKHRKVKVINRTLPNSYFKWLKWFLRVDVKCFPILTLLLVPCFVDISKRPLPARVNSTSYFVALFNWLVNLFIPSIPTKITQCKFSVGVFVCIFLPLNSITAVRILIKFGIITYIVCDLEYLCYYLSRNINRIYRVQKANGFRRESALSHADEVAGRV